MGRACDPKGGPIIGLEAETILLTSGGAIRVRATPSPPLITEATALAPTVPAPAYMATVRAAITDVVRGPEPYVIPSLGEVTTPWPLVALREPSPVTPKIRVAGPRRRGETGRTSSTPSPEEGPPAVSAEALAVVRLAPTAKVVGYFTASLRPLVGPIVARSSRRVRYAPRPGSFYFPSPAFVIGTKAGEGYDLGRLSALIRSQVASVS